MPTAVIIFLVFLILVIIRYIVWPDDPQPKLSHPTSKASPSEDIMNILSRGIKNVELDDGTVLCVNSGTIIQALESMAIIESTANIDTLISRYIFLVDKLNHIHLAYKDDTVGHIMAQSQALATYNLEYPNYKATQEMEDIIKHPNTDIKDFYSKNIIHCLSLYSDKIEQEINSLKTEAAKKRRREKVIACVTTCVTELNQRGNSEYIYQIPNVIARFDISVDIKRPSEQEISTLDTPKEYVRKV